MNYKWAEMHDGEKVVHPVVANLWALEDMVKEALADVDKISENSTMDELLAIIKHIEEMADDSIQAAILMKVECQNYRTMDTLARQDAKKAS